jgi:hypothetical protein
LSANFAWQVGAVQGKFDTYIVYIYTFFRIACQTYTSTTTSPQISNQHRPDHAAEVLGKELEGGELGETAHLGPIESNKVVILCRLLLILKGARTVSSIGLYVNLTS